MKFEQPILTVDIVLFALAEDGLRIALTRRQQAPFEGQLALPGGCVRVAEDSSTKAAALRILKSTFDLVPSHIEQVFTVASPARDPMGWSASVVYLALHPLDSLQVLVEAGRAELLPVGKKGDVQGGALAFDHSDLVQGAVGRLVAKAGYTTIVAHFLGDTFTIPELQWAYETVLGRKVDSANFRRKVLELNALKKAAMKAGFGRPATAYRLKKELAYFDRPMA